MEFCHLLVNNWLIKQWYQCIYRWRSSDFVDPAAGVSFCPVQSQRLGVPKSVDPTAGVPLSPVQSQRLGIPSDSVDLAAGVPVSPVEFQLLTCAAGYQRAAVDALLFPV